MTLSHPFVRLLCLSVMNLEEGQRDPRPPYPTHFRKSSYTYLLTYVLILTFALAHEQCVSYDGLHLPYPTRVHMYLWLALHN